MSDELTDIRERVTKASGELLAAILIFEHAVADTTTVESAHLVCETIGQCYSAFDRLNGGAITRLARLQVERDLAALRVVHD